MTDITKADIDGGYDGLLPDKKISLSEEEYAELQAKIDSLTEDVANLRIELDERA